MYTGTYRSVPCTKPCTVCSLRIIDFLPEFLLLFYNRQWWFWEFFCGGWGGGVRHWPLVCRFIFVLSVAQPEPLFLIGAVAKKKTFWIS